MKARQAITEFLRHGQSVRQLSDRTLRAYESDLSQFREHVSDQEVSAVTSADLEGYVAQLGDGDYRDTSIRRKVAALKVFFRYLEDQGHIGESPAKKLKIRQPSEARVPNVLTTKEIRALLEAPKRQIEQLSRHRDQSVGSRNRYFCAVRDNAIIELLFSTGIRIGELVALNTGDIDLENRKMAITGRGTRGRDVTVTSQVVWEALVAYLKLRDERELQNDALFVGRSGTRLTIYSIENIFKKYVRNADIKRHVTPHALRHTMASMLISGGADLRSVQEMLGHASILSTQVYTRLSLPRVKRAPSDGNRMSVDPAARLPIKR